MSDGYKPRAGSVASRAIELLQRQPAETEIVASDLAGQLGATEKNLAALLRGACNANLLDFRSEVRGGVRVRLYRLGTQPEDEQPAERTGPLDMQHFSDGDLVVDGLTVGEDGRVLFKKHQLEQFVEFVTRPAVTVGTTTTSQE